MEEPSSPIPRRAPQPWTVVDRANRLLRDVSKVFDLMTESQGWPTGFTPIRFLVLAHLQHATTFGLTPKRLAWLLRLPPSSLAYHLDTLEAAGMGHLAHG